MLVSLLVFVTIAVLAIPAALVLIPFTLLSGNVVRSTSRAAGSRAPPCGSPAFAFKSRAGKKFPPGRACIFFANHVSNLDAPALICNLPGRTSVFLKRPLMKLPILGYAFKLANFIPVDRTGSTESAQEAVADAERVLADGLHITTFIEGMRSLDGRMLPFKKGAFYLAKDSGAPCIPVSIFGTEKIIPWGSNRIHPGVAHVVFHPAAGSCRLRHSRRIVRSRPRRHRLRAAGMDAQPRTRS